MIHDNMTNIYGRLIVCSVVQTASLHQLSAVVYSMWHLFMWYLFNCGCSQ